MKIKILEIKKESIQNISMDDFQKRGPDSSSLYIYDILTDDRHEAASHLKDFGINEEVLNGIQNPAENIRFEYYGSTAYGEIAFFSPKSDNPTKYMGVVNFQNIIFLIHSEEHNISESVVRSLTTTIEYSSEMIDAGQVLYILILEILTSHGKLILSYREEIEDIAKDMDNNMKEFDMDEFLEAKSYLSDFSRVLERLHFSLSFPPAKNVLDKESSYKIYFKELLTNIQLLIISLSQTEQRLDSLHDHYDLMLQEKSNKRLNFLTIIQAIFVPLTLVAGIYGMNFVNMPELNLKYGYFFSLGAMVFIAFWFVRYFKKNGWFD